jgi:SAM-dependent methyltransferase
MRGDPQRHFDRIAEAYENVPETLKSVYARARQEIEPAIRGKVVLDVGNGGHFPYDTEIADKVIALDISPAMLEHVKNPKILKQLGNATDLKDFQDESLDVILYVFSIHHMNDANVEKSCRTLDRVLYSAHRILKNGGALIIVEPTLHPTLFFLEKVLFHATKWFFSAFKVSMIFFYSKDFLSNRILRQFGGKDDHFSVIPLPIEGFVDPLGGSFPGLIRIPGWLSPTRYFLFYCTKTEPSACAATPP